MIYLFQAAFPTLGMMIYEIFYKKERKNPLIYICIFFALAAANYGFDMCLHAQENTVHAYKLTPQQRQYYKHLIKQHYDSAYDCSSEANSWCDIIPHAVYRAAAKAATAGLSVAIISRNITSAAITAVITALQELLERFGETWDCISSNLHCAKYNIEMIEFYQNVLNGEEK